MKKMRKYKEMSAAERLIRHPESRKRLDALVQAFCDSRALRDADESEACEGLMPPADKH